MKDLRKLIDIVSNPSVLLEYNVINIPDIENWIKELASQIQYEPAKEWFTGAVRRFLVNDPSSNVRVTSLGPSAPDYLKKALQQGDELYRWHSTTNLQTRLRHVIDWLNSLYMTSQEHIDPASKNANKKQQLKNLAEKYLKTLNAIDIKKLVAEQGEKEKHHVEDWFKELSSIADTEEDIAGTEDYIVYPNGFRWVHVKSKKSLQREGKLMQHCVGSYGDAVESGRTQIYSLRDPQNHPHCTVEVLNNEVNQIKGKQNKAPVPKYSMYVKDFLNKIKKSPTYYGKNDLTTAGIVYDADSNSYGSLRDFSQLLATLPDGMEIIRTKNHEIHMWYKNGDYGQIIMTDRKTHIWYKNGDPVDDTPEAMLVDIVPNTIHEDATRNASLQNEVIKDAVTWINETYKNTKIIVTGNAEKQGYHFHDDRVKHLSEIPHIEQFEHCLVKQVQVREGMVYKFIDPSSNDTLFKITDTGSIISDGKYIDISGIIPSQLLPDVMSFLKKYFPDGVSNLAAYVNNDIIFDDGKWKWFKDIKPFTSWGNNGGIYYFKPYCHVYDDNGKLAASFVLKQYSRIKIINSAILTKHASDLAEFLNGQKFSGDKDFTSKLKSLGIIYSKNKWGVAKTVGKTEDPEGFSMRKVGEKTLLLISPEGEKVGQLSRESANQIKDVNLNNLQAAEYLARWSSVNPTVKFWTKINKDKNVLDYRYFIHDGKFVKISSIYPTRKITDSGPYTWKRVAYIFGGIEPIENRWGLYNAENQLALVVDASDQKNITKIIPVAENKAIDFNEENIAPYISDLNAIKKATNAVFPGNILAKANLEIRDDEIQIIAQSGKVRAFTNGTIAYEDGHVWLRNPYDKTEWHLLENIEEKYNYILTCKVSNGVIQNVKFEGRYQKNKKLYRQYLNDMLDILDEMD